MKRPLIALWLTTLVFMASTIYVDIEQNGRIKQLEQKIEAQNQLTSGTGRAPLKRINMHGLLGGQPKYIKPVR